MNVLYLTEDYFASKVHNNLLIKELEQDPSLNIYVFTPIRFERKSLSSSYKENERLHVISPQIDISNNLYKFDFWAKIRCKVRLIEQNIPIGEIDCIHAATLYSEGAVALALKKKYRIPYLVSMRGCDAMTYTRKMFHLWCKGNNVLKNADIVASVTPAIKEKMINSWQYISNKKILEDSLVINNGIDEIWLNNIVNEAKQSSNPFRIIYIGRFDTNKNVMRLIKAVKLCKEKHDVQLVLVGGKGEEHELVIAEVKSYKYIEYLGEIYDKEKLMSVIRSCDLFAMVSHSETFGLVYAECLTQHLPLVYTKRTGFDGMYPDGFVGYHVDSCSTEAISDAIENVMNNYKIIQENISTIDYSLYSWDNIINRYIELYHNVQVNEA